MIKTELIAKIADENPTLLTRDARRIVEAVFREIEAALVEGRRVELRGFGAFSVKTHEARIGRNPRTGEAVHVPEKRHVKFKAGRGILRRLNDHN